jgi:hypothetical protein
MSATLSPRLPGLRFEAPPLSQAEVLPRMDIPAFVGFAASGPLHTPVPVEDEAYFTDVFGPDPPLAWDAESCEAIYAYLGPTVRAFFRNGGRRCWVVRVAGVSARVNEFPVSGLARAALNQQGEITSITQACAQARCEGQWSDGLRVSATLDSRPIEVLQFWPRAREIELALRSPDTLAEGDLLRLQDRAHGVVVLFPVQRMEERGVMEPASPPNPAFLGARRVSVFSRSALWLKAAWAKRPSSNEANVCVLQSCTPCHQRRALLALPWPATHDEPVILDIDIPFPEAPALGSLLEVATNAEHLWLTVEQLSAGDPHGSPPQPTVRVSGPAWWWINPAVDESASPPVELTRPTGERLAFEFWVRRGEENAFRLRDLGFAPGQPRYWAELPADAQLYADASTAFPPELPTLWREVTSPRFPLAGVKEERVFYFPLNISATPEHFTGPIGLLDDALERDGLATFEEDLFLDGRMRAVGLGAFNAEADFVRYQVEKAEPLKGIHAALSIEEATLIAVPDAVHRGWGQGREEAPATSPSALLERAEWWHFLPCDPPPEIPRESKPHWGEFLDCGIEDIEPPSLATDQTLNWAGTFTLTVQSNLNGVRLIIEEAREPDFSDATELPFKEGTSVQVFGRAVGDYFYRARAVKGRNTSDWSNSVGVRVTTRSRWVATTRRDYSPSTLLAVQRALLRLCGARADMLAILSLPEHYREDAAIMHLEALKPPRYDDSTTTKPADQSSVLGLTLGEQAALNYGAVYHPWLEGREAGLEFRRTPPDGAACGVLARRALSRGAWIAPANEPWRGVVALAPALAAERRLDLQEARINLVRQEPRAFLTLCADTLSPEPDLRFIHVRRLLILLRRLALKLGATYVFEPNDASFRRLVQRNFEALLEDLFHRGAFAGKTAGSSFQVVTSDELNTPQNIEQGRFIVELRVAPAQPLTFVTLRLVQSGAGRLAVVEE